MSDVIVVILHADIADDSELVRILEDVRTDLVLHHVKLFRDAGATDVRVEREWHDGMSFGEVLASRAPARGGLIVLSAGAVPLLSRHDAARLVDAAAAANRIARTNNRYSSDVCAVAEARVLKKLPALPTDNALPRWLEEHAGYSVSELSNRARLGIDLDTPGDVALAALSRSAPRWLRDKARAHALAIPRLSDLRQLSQDPLAELLVFGRSSAATLRWLERNVRCRVRFLAEERGLRASSTLAINSGGGDARLTAKPRATLGLLLDETGPESFAALIASLAQGAIVDTRVLLAHRLGADETEWPRRADRFASDLHRPAEITDAWLRSLTESVAESRLPILLGGHSLVGPGIPLLLG